MRKRRIFSQGDYDGACFLYALANAYQAVSGRIPGCGEWDRGITALPEARAFLQGCVGTTRHYDQDRDLQAQAMAAMLASFAEVGPPVTAEWCDDCQDLAAIAALIDHAAVVVFRYRGQTARVAADDHWTCGVAVTAKPFRLHLACSFRHAQDGRLNSRRYREYLCQDVGRYANDWVNMSHGIAVVPGAVCRLRQATDRSHPPPRLQPDPCR